MLAAHLVFSVYGFWLPNDPRGSWSEFVRCWDVFWAGGKGNKTFARHSVAYEEHDDAARVHAKRALDLPEVKFGSLQARAVARGFKNAAIESDYHVLALAILPDHIHAVTARHAHTPGRVIEHLKTRATQELIARGVHPFSSVADEVGVVPSVWARRGWSVFIDREDDVRAAIEYVRQNPLKAGMPEQRYSFVDANL